ncbi:MAG: hypothetical protein ACLFM1_01580 [Bacteroidales bacterium]
MKNIIFLLFGFCFLPGHSQDLAVYTDYLDKVQLFDGGEFTELEHLPLKSYQIGNTCLGYEDNAENFKIYYNHYTHKINSFVSNYTVTDNLVAFNLNSQLKVFDQGNTETLSTLVGKYAVGDEMVAFFDRQQQIFKVYYMGEVFELYDGLAGDEATKFSVGENTMIYRDNRNYLNLFYQGEIFDLLYEDRAVSYKVGRDMAAWVEAPMNNFHVFHKGNFIELETFEPKSYSIGDGFLAYLDSNDYLKIYDGEEIITVTFDTPGMYEVIDELLIYTIQDYFKVYWQGQSYTLENFKPENYVCDMNILAWEDEQGNLKVFDRGRIGTISYEDINTLECHGHTVFYSYGVQSNDIYWHGDIYTGE